MTIQMEDRAVLAQSSIKRTADGYLAAHARVARTGIQIYAGQEVGRADLEKVRVYRPESEVFRKDAMTSLAHRPITKDHPPVPVTADNWKKYAIGHVGDEVVRDGQFVRVPMLVMDADSIRHIEQDGARELSVGYVCDIAWETGISPAGEEYDAIQRNIKVNHIAVVKAARGGSNLRIGDASYSCPECGAKWSGPSKKCPECGYEVKDSAEGAVAADRMRHDGNNEGDERMKTIVVDGISLEMPETAAAVVDKVIKSLTDQAKSASDGKSTADAQVATLTTQLAAKDAELTTLKKQVDDLKVTPQKLDELVKTRAAVVDKAKKLLGPDKLVVDGKSEHEIRKQVVDSIVGDAAKGWDENQVAASFVAIAADKKTDDGVQDISRGFSGIRQVLGDDRSNAYAERDRALEDAWKGAPAA